MFIKKILSQHRRDFTAIYECGHCGHTCESTGYDDKYYHHSVVPNLTCPKCGKSGEDNYRPLTTKYSEGYQI